MAKKDSTRQDEPQTIELLESEWDEIERCAMAFHAALKGGAEDEGIELLESVYRRLSRSVEDINRRLG